MRDRAYRIRFLLFATVTMTYARGWEGDYGNELGAMVPGAMVAMAVCLASGRRDWWNRCLVWAMFAAIGWGFPGSLSYGLIIGYTQHSDFWGVAYGFACLFVIGFFYGAYGGAFLGIAITQPRRKLDTFIGPIVAIGVVWVVLYWCGMRTWSEDFPTPCSYDGKWLAVVHGLGLRNTGVLAYVHKWTAPLQMYDVDWLAAVSAFIVAGVYALVARRSHGARLLALMAWGWLVGFCLLTLILGWRMTPPRSDQWAGITGMFVVVVGYLVVQRLRAARVVMAYGGLFGGLGFAIGALFLSLAGAWGWPVNAWRFMEQFFGLLMGLGVGIGVWKLASHDLAPAEEDTPRQPLNLLAIVVLFPAMIGMNLFYSVYEWLNFGKQEAQAGKVWTLTPQIYGISVFVWFGAVAVLAVIVLAWALLRHRRDPFTFVPSHPLGQGQLLYLVMLWVTVAAALALKAPRLADSGQFHSQFSFGVLALICTFLLLTIPAREVKVTNPRPANDPTWRLGWRYGLLLALVAPLVIAVLTSVAVRVHPEPLPGSSRRFHAEQMQ